MNVLFITLEDVHNISFRSISSDLMRYFVQEGHCVYVVSPAEKRNNGKTELISQDNCEFLKVRTGNIQQNKNLIDKGLSIISLEYLFIRAIKKYFDNVRFNLVVYLTPPVTIAGVVSYIKKRDDAITYLMLKDIFPQNAVDFGMMSKTGIKSVIYKFFRSKEKKLYKASDYIGCTSPKNIEYTKIHNSFINDSKLELCVNCMEPYSVISREGSVSHLRLKYDLPLDKKIFIYGGNLGRPQGVPFLLECLKKTKGVKNAFFLIVGSGTEKEKLKECIRNNSISNARFMDYLPKEEFDTLTAACDVGMIFLDYATTTPNTPTRLLSYTNASIPILAVTDPCTDVGDIVESGGFGWKCYSNDCEKYYALILKILETENWDELKNNSHNYLLDHYTPKHAYESIMRHFS